MNPEIAALAGAVIGFVLTNFLAVGTVGGFASLFPISGLLKITGLFCRISSLLKGSFAKKTYETHE